MHQYLEMIDETDETSVSQSSHLLVTKFGCYIVAEIAWIGPESINTTGRNPVCVNSQLYSFTMLKEEAGTLHQTS